MLRFKVITLDIHNTLLRVHQSAGQQYSRIARQHGILVDPHVLDDAFAVALADQRRKMPNYGVQKGLSSSAWWNEVVLQTFAMSCSSNGPTISKISTVLYDEFKTPSTWHVFPEVRSTLASLGKHGVRLGVISNSDERLMDVLRSTNLSQHFACVMLSVHAGHEKPRAEIFQMALESLGVEPGSCLHVGDSVTKDYTGAREVGMSAVIVDRDCSLSREHPEIERGHFIRDLSELKALAVMQH